MPWANPADVDQDPVLPQPAKPYREPTDQGKLPGLFDVFAEGARQGLAGSLYERYSEGPTPDSVAGYDPTDDLAGYEDHWKELVRSRSPAETRMIKNRIDSNLKGLQTIADAGGWGTSAALTFQLLDIPTLLSMMLPAAAPIAWGSRAERVGAVVGAQMTFDTASELAMHKLHSERTVGQSMLNIGASALLTGMVGAVASRVPKAQFNKLADDIRADLHEPPIKAKIEPAPIEAPAPKAAEPAAAAEGAPPRVAETPPEPPHEPAAHVVTDITSRFHPLRAQAWKIKASMNKLKSIDRNDLRAVGKFVGRKVESLGAFVKRTGGIWDSGGEGAARDVTPKTAPGMVRAKRYGKDGQDASMDAVRERVYNAGYFPNKNNYNEVSDEDIWDAIAEEASGNRLYTGDVEDQLKSVEVDERAYSDFMQAGFTHDMSVEDIVKHLASEDLDEVGPLQGIDDDELQTALAEYHVSEPPEFIVNPGDESTVGAARVGETSLDDETILRGGQWISKVFGKINPVLRLLNSPVVEARRLMQEVGTVTFMLNKHMRGVRSADSVEARTVGTIRAARQWFAHHYDTAYKAYRESVATSGLEEGAKRPLTHYEFGEAMMRAAQEGDTSAIPEVEKVAKLIRRDLFDPLKEQAQATGAMKGSGLTIGAPSYAPRIYDHSVIKRTQGELEQMLYKEFWDGTKEPAEVMAEVRQTIDAMMGVRLGSADIGGPGVAAHLQKRLLDVPDRLLRPWLIMDYENVVNGYLRSVVPQIEMYRSFGSIDLKAEIGGIMDAYDRKLLAAKSNEAKAKLIKRRDQDIEDLSGVRDRVLNQVGPRANENVRLVRAARLFRSYNYVRSLGKQTLSSLPDSGRVVARFGLARTAAATAQFLTDVHLNKMARADAQRMGTAVAHTLDSRGGTLAEIGDELPGSKAERFANVLSHKFTQATLMASWNNTWQSITSLLQQDAVARAALGAKLSAFKAGEFAQFGMNDAMLKRMGEQFTKFGEQGGGLWRARTDLWADREAAKVLEDSVVALGDIMVMHKGAGDLPLIMDKEIYRTLLQFKSFGMASVARTLVPMGQGIAAGDMATINGAGVMLGLGSLSYYLREVASGNEPDLSPSRVIAESLNWSGLLAFLPDIYDPVANGIFHVPFRFSRYADRSPIETGLGPTFGTASDLFGAAARLGDVLPWAEGSGLKDKDIHMARKLVPFQNVFWLHRVVNGLEGEVSEAAGAEGSDYQDFAERVLESKSN